MLLKNERPGQFVHLGQHQGWVLLFIMQLVAPAGFDLRVRHLKLYRGRDFNIELPGLLISDHPLLPFNQYPELKVDWSRYNFLLLAIAVSYAGECAGDMRGEMDRRHDAIKSVIEHQALVILNEECRNQCSQ